MTHLAENLQARLSDWQPAGAGRHSWSTDLGEWKVQLSADRADSLSCLVWELTLTRVAEPPAGLTLEAWATGIASRVGGLMEDLKVYEVDEVSKEAVLRSEAPTTRGEKVAYYEIRLHGLSHAELRRFTSDKQKPGREQIAFALTHEMLGHVVEDITA